MLDRFLQSPASQQARVQVQLPNGEMMDITEISLLENRILGSTARSHRLVFKCRKNQRHRPWVKSLENYNSLLG